MNWFSLFCCFNSDDGMGRYKGSMIFYILNERSWMFAARTLSCKKIQQINNCIIGILSKDIVIFVISCYHIRVLEMAVFQRLALEGTAFPFFFLSIITFKMIGMHSYFLLCLSYLIWQKLYKYRSNKVLLNTIVFYMSCLYIICS